METISIPIKIKQLEPLSYHLLIEASTKDGQVHKFIIDTGASKTVFDINTFSDKVKELKQTEEEHNKAAGIDGNPLQTYLGILPYLKIGESYLLDMKCHLMDMAPLNTVYQKISNTKISGLIGSDLLYKNKAKIDYEKKRLELIINKNTILNP